MFIRSIDNYECVGIGCGPSNLSIASLLHDNKEVKNIFFDVKPSFTWHDGMMLPNTSLQVSMFKDLVTLADPTNKFSFVSYLHQQGRLFQFLNSNFDQISRLEFADYFKWAADNNDNICFNERVNSIDFDDNHFVIDTSCRRVLGKNIIIGVGIEPHTPELARKYLDDNTCFHAHDFTKREREFKKKRVVVVGGGQSGAEIILDLLTRTHNGSPLEIAWVSRRENFFPIDDSPFTNDFFTPSYSDYFFEQDFIFRQGFIKRNILASDGISKHTLQAIYQRIYVMRHIEKSPVKIKFMPYRDLSAIERKKAEWWLKIKHLSCGKNELLASDVIIWATGFHSAPISFLRPLKTRIRYENEEIKIDKNYAAIWDGPSDRKIFVLNSARYQRGLADPNLSLTAWRSQIIINTILGRQQNIQKIDNAFINWQAVISEEIIGGDTGKMNINSNMLYGQR